MSENFAGGSLVDWRKALEPIDPMLAYQLHEAPDPYQQLQELGLPTPPYVGFDTVDAFLDNPGAGIQPLTRQGIDAFYVGLRPHQPHLTKFRELGLAAHDLPAYIQANVAPQNYSSYHLRIAEYAPAVYGATMIIDPSGRLRLEMVQGEMSNLATGAQSPEHVVTADEFTGVLRYSFDDTELRSVISRTIAGLPRAVDGSASPRARLHGYYEFSLIRRAGRLRPVFFDYKGSSAFSLPSS